MGKESLIKSTTSKKGKSATKKKTPTKTTSSPKPTSRKKPPAKPKKKKIVDMKELLFKKFEKTQEPVLFVPIQDSTKTTQPASADVTMDENTRSIMLRKYSMAEIKKVAKPPGPQVEELHEKSTPVVAPSIETSVPEQNGCADDTPSIPARKDPIVKSMSYGVLALVVMLILVIGASISNNGKYYLVQNNDSVEIWRGRFSPMGKRFEGILHNYQLVDPVKSQYSKQEIYPAVFNYYLEKADNLLNQQNPPDFQAIIGHLDEAKAYAVTSELKQAVDTRLNNIHLMTLIYKADVASMKNSAPELKSAIKYLQEAKRFTAEPEQLQSINTKIGIIQNRIDTLPASESNEKQEEGVSESEGQAKE